MFERFRNRGRKIRRVTARKSAWRLETLESREVPAGLFASVSTPGTAAQVTIEDSTTWATKFTVNPFNGFTGSITTAIADVNGDGTDDVIVAAGVGSAPLIAEYSGADGTLIRTLTIGDASSTNGATVAAVGKNTAGDVLLAVASDLSGVATVQIVKAADGTVVSSFQPFGDFTGALSISATDVNGDGVADIIVGAGAGGGPRLAVFDGTTGKALFDAFAFESTFNGGINVTAGDVSGGTTPDVVVAAGFTGGPRVSVYSTTTWTKTQDFFAYDSSERAGVTASVFASTAGATSNAIITNDGQGQTDGIKAFNGSTLATVTPPTLPGLPGGPPLATMSAPTLTTTVTPPIDLTSDSGMVSTIPDVNSSSWQTQSDGLKIWDVQTGTGTAVTSSSTLGVYYTGWLLNGTVFDSDRSPKSPASFALTGLIQGWQEGLIGMKPGGIRRLYIPAALAYGSAGSGAVPANSDLVFEIKLISVS